MESMYEKVMYYFLRHEEMGNDMKAKKGQPYGMVALRLNEDGTVNRGVAICSKVDKFNKDTAKGLALSRLMKAETDCKSTDEFADYSDIGKSRNMDKEFLDKIRSNYKYKKCFHENILPREHRMYYKPEGR